MKRKWKHWYKTTLTLKEWKTNKLQEDINNIIREMQKI